MSRTKWLEFMHHLADCQTLKRFVTESDEGQVTLWCVTNHDLLIPHHELPGIWDPTNGNVDYLWEDDGETTEADKPKEPKLELKIMSTEEGALFRARITQDMNRRTNEQ